MHCASCDGVLDDALILVCDHNLCLGCAANNMEARDKGYVVICGRCGSITDVDSDSAEQLRSQYPPPPSTVTPVNGHSNFNNSRPSIGGVAANSFSVSPPPRGTVDDRRASNSRLGPRGSFTMNTSGGSGSGHLAVPSCGQCARGVASIRCANCDEDFCEKCASLIHRRGRMVDHHLSPIEPVAPLPSLNASRRAASQSSSQLPVSVKMIRTCPVHESEHVQYFCLSCEGPPMCSECVMRSEEHTKHLNQVFLLKKALPLARCRIEELQRGLASRLGDIRQSEADVDQNRRDLDALLEKTKETIHASFASLRASLDRKEQELLSKAESKVAFLYFAQHKLQPKIRAEWQRVDGIHRELQSKREKVEAVALQMEESMGMNDEVATLASYSEIKQQMNSLASREDHVKLSGVRMEVVDSEAFERRVGEVRRSIDGIRGLKLGASRTPSTSSRHANPVDGVTTSDTSPPQQGHSPPPPSQPNETQDVERQTGRFMPSPALPRSIRPSAPAIVTASAKRPSRQDQLLMSAVDDVLEEDWSPASQPPPGPARGGPKRKTHSSAFSTPDGDNVTSDGNRVDDATASLPTARSSSGMRSCACPKMETDELVWACSVMSFLLMPQYDTYGGPIYIIDGCDDDVEFCEENLYGRSFVGIDFEWDRELR
ncbi:hypothetical protein FOZ62_023928, partial [Perkinsus olseni]